MICRRCLMLKRQTPISISTTTKPLLLRRPLSTTLAVRNAAPAAAAESSSAEPAFSTPLGDGEAEEKPMLSSCPAGTVLQGLNYFKNKQDPVALADDKYPEWLWDCLEVQKKSDDGAAADEADEYSKSKKQRRLAAKRQRALEAKLMAEGNLEALMPKIPMQQQSINMPANEEGTAEGSIAAVTARENLTKAMRKERKAKIKEANYLKTM